VSLDSAGVKVSESEAGWRIHVGKELQRKGAAELKERLPVSTLKGGRRKVMTEELNERSDWIVIQVCLLGMRGCYVEEQCMLEK